MSVMSQEYFDHLAADFDTPARRQRAALIAEELAGHLVLGPGRRVLDFGCGTGLISFYLEPRGGTFTMFDSSPGMIDVARKKIAAAGTSTMMATGEEAWGPGEFDSLFTSMVLHHVVDLPPLLEKFHRWTSLGGRLAIVDLNPDDGSFHADEPGFTGHHGFDPGALSRLAQATGYTPVHQDTFFHSTRMAGGKEVAYSLFVLVLEKR